MRIGETFINNGRTFIVKATDAAGNVTDCSCDPGAIAAPGLERDALLEKVMADPELIEAFKNRLGITSDGGEKRTSCQYCGRECKQGLAQHEAACKEGPEKKRALIEEAAALGLDTEGKTGGELAADIKARKAENR